MPFKYDEAGNIAVQDVGGKKLPVFIGADGKESPFDGDSTVATISRLNGEAKSHRERAETAEASLKTFEGITDPAAALKALTTVKNLDDKKLVDAGEVEKVKAEAIKSVEEKFAPTVQRAADLEAQLNQHLIGGAFSGSKYIAEKFAAEGPAGVEIARALFANRFKVEDGKLVAYDGAGGKIYSRTRHGELADADEAIELMVDAYPHKTSLLKGSGASGGGAHGGGGGNGGKKTMTRAQFSQLSPADQAKAAAEAVITD
ncbi:MULTISPECIES: DUF6651 domain-containing protein [unclassified Cupriavidus]|uniref:DUF6651 domain-containing protein n=1 Tax=unclassified Cupriavidus TaxID=2640874 RepID=UPI00313F3520